MLQHFYNIINILGGVCLFLYGAAQSTDAFRAAFSASTREAVSQFTRKKPKAMLFGAALAAVAQGSTVSTSIAISLADVGMLSLAGAVVVMMGASIGGTFVTFLISLDIVSLSPLLITVSYLMIQFGGSKTKKIGGVFRALALILLGMFLLKLGVDPLLANPTVRDAVVGVGPVTMFFVALVGTAVLQSSASVMALAVTIAMSGALPVDSVFPVALGSHLGSTVTMLLAAMGGRRNARILGLSTFLYKLIGTAAFVPLVPGAEAFLARIGFLMPTNIVLAQTLLVIFNAVIFYPWPQILSNWSAYLLSKLQKIDLGNPLYLDEKMLEIPSLATRLLAKEMIRLCNYIEALLQALLYHDKTGNELEKLLPDGIKELTEACERYMYAIHPPSIAVDSVTELEYRSTSYAMLSLREVSHVATQRFRKQIKKTGLKKLASEMTRAEWDKMAELFMKTVRDAFHAFALGDADLVARATQGKDDFGKVVAFMRTRLLGGETGRRENSALLDFVTAETRILRGAIEAASGDVLIQDKAGEKAGENIDQ
ncbi:sodium:phosphate symporter [Synergistales bacterium]|nr:sodium:phosphate symporter [Synergistales bacterium]